MPKSNWILVEDTRDKKQYLANARYKTPYEATKHNFGFCEYEEALKAYTNWRTKNAK